ncbi:transient receptor potential cation channel subfamily M member 7-like [Spea bombifrons]|uniref:transient receptor potential cation channel subfamily M member 7-like n=1 Tax=Spea bombifrons TaxID=233779 RepID=UPI002349B8D3|nr:transient receptor potential cation channel subfamily M member 7-like [Spea bombifrons]
MNHIPWIEKTFHKRDCVHIIPSSREPHRCIPGCQICQKLVRCCCGRLVRQHSWYNGSPSINLSGVHSKLHQETGPWTSDKHTVKSSTDAYGTIAFQGGSHGFKSKYIRISNDSKAEDILHLMVKVWKMNIPRLVISVHGGMQKFELQPSLKEALYKGLVKAAVTTGAWILTGGINNGVADHIGEAIKEDDSRLSHTVCTVGIAPWGIIEGRNDLLGQNVVAPYQTLTNPLSKLHVLNSYHSHFILVDDGTVGRQGGEMHIRRGLEWKISQQQIHARTGRRVPLVALIIEGGPNTIHTVFEYLQQSPPVPVVVCEGSGRAADLLAYIYKQTESCGSLPEGLETDVMSTIRKMFALNQNEATHLFQTLLACMRVKNLITVFHAESGEHLDIDVAILTALLKGINTSPSDQFVLALAWNRVDIAKNQIFLHGQQWRASSLEQAMLDALVMDRVDFVKLLIENGVSMHKFLTIPRLEELYNAKQNVNIDTLLHLIQDVKKGHIPAGYKITLLDVGLVIEYLMGGSYRCSYTKKHFRAMYKTLNQRSARNKAGTSLPHSESKEHLDGVGIKEKTRHGHFIQTAQPYKPKVNDSSIELKNNSGRVDIVENEDQMPKPFTYPFNELLVWAALTKRQKMALFFWQHGEESMAKALVARKLYQAMAHEARQSVIVDDTSQKLNEYSKEFGELAVELLDKAYQQNERMTMKLLTYELSNWSKSTCLELAVSSRLRSFVGHTCTQKLLSDMWMGRLNMRKNSWFKVILGLLMPPIIPLLEYKTEEQMSHIPQSQDAHEMIVDEKDEVKHFEEDIAMDTFNEVTFSDGVWGNSSEKRTERKHCYLPLARKFYAFYHAPIVKFWFNTLAYMAFLMLYTFVVLVKMESLPSVQEWIVISIIFTTGLEKIREVMSQAGKITQKLKVWFCSYFNANDTVAIITFLIGVGLRLGSIQYTNDGSTENLVLIAGRLIYCLNIIFWIVRLLDILNVNPDAGPYVLMIGKMISKMFFIVVIMGIVVIAFGVPKKAILYPQETPSWSLAKEVIFRPYWMTFGEVYAYEIDVCANDSVVPELCGTGTWLTQFLQAVYLFVQYIIMVNLLIAIFNNVYKRGKAISDMLWKFQRYHLIMIYQDKPILPPPLILISHLASIINWLCRRQKKSKAHRTKLFLTEDEQKTLHDFEQHCVGIYFRDKKDHDSSKSEERIRVTNERVEKMFNEMKDVGDRVSFIKHSLRCLDHHIGHLQDLSGLTLDSVNTLMAQRALESSRSHSVTSCDLSLSRYTSDDGIGRSVTGKKSKSDYLMGRSFSQPGNNPRMTKSQRKSNISEAGPTVSGLFQKVDSLPDFQQHTLCEDGNTCICNQKLKSLIKKTNPALVTAHMSSQVLARKPMKSEIKSVQSKHDSEQPFSQSFEPANNLYTDSEGTCKPEGYINGGFIDDKGHSIDVSEDSIKDTEQAFKPWVNQPGEMRDGGISQEEHTGDYHMDRAMDNINPILRGNKFVGMFQKFWTKSKNTDGGHHVVKQMSSEIDSADMEAYHEEETNSFSTNHLQFDGAATSYEESQQSDSKAALLRESYYSRYSSSHRNMPFQEDSLNGFSPHFIPSMDMSFYYSAIERNNLFRLSQSIPFTPLPPAGELVTVYRLEESSPDILNNSMSSWLQQGLYAKIEFLGREEMGGGLRRAVKVACAWCENHILKAGYLYIIKSFLPEVVDTWAGVYKEDTVLQLCLREIQQQRAAQKLLFAFNQMKPKTIAFSPKFLEVFLLYCHSARQWFTVEECMAGRFKKYNNNTGNENVPKNKLEETMLAFSHWTYEYTKGEFLVLDLQGVGENLTDPCVIKAGDGRSRDMIFGPANLGDDAIQNFCSQHQCNSCCRTLKLPELKINDYLQHETPENSIVHISHECSREGTRQHPIPDRMPDVSDV